MRYVYIPTEIIVVFRAYGVQCNTEGIYCSKLYQNVAANLEEVFPTLIPSKSTIYWLIHKFRKRSLLKNKRLQIWRVIPEEILDYIGARSETCPRS